MHRAGSRRVPVQSFCIVFIQDVLPSWHLCVTICKEYRQPGSSPMLWCPELLLGLHYTGVFDWLPTRLNSVFGSADAVLLKDPTLGTRLVCLAWPALNLTLLGMANPTLWFKVASFYARTVGVAGATLKKDIPIRYDINYLPEPKAKARYLFGQG